MSWTITCIYDDELVSKTIKMMRELLQNNSYLIIKDTVTSKKTKYYADSKYSAIYRNEDEYFNMYKPYFEIVNKEYLSSYNKKNIGYIIALLKTID